MKKASSLLFVSLLLGISNCSTQKTVEEVPYKPDISTWTAPTGLAKELQGERGNSLYSTIISQIYVIGFIGLVIKASFYKPLKRLEMCIVNP